ncbi:MAG: hypothetical protein ACR2PH_13345 [Desulfobulbia bacterium]
MTEFDQYKFDAVYKYLSIGFPGLSIDQAYDEERMALTFSVTNNDEIYVVKFTKKYWDRCDANTIFKRLKILDVANALRKNPKKNVVVNKSINLGFEPK